MRYFLKYSYYIIISIIFTIIISLIIGEAKFELFPIVVIMLYLLRILDDYFDYEIDKKEKLLNKKALKIFAMILSVVFIVLNVLFYGYYGLISIAILIYMLIQNKIEILKIFSLLFNSIYYICIYNKIGSMPAIIYLVCTLIISSIYYIYKRSKKR